MPMAIVLVIVFALGVLVTYAEPAVGALLTLAPLVDKDQAPYLYYILHQWVEFLIFAIGAGVGLSAVFGTMRLMYGWSLKTLVSAITIPAMILTAYLVWGQEGMDGVVGLSWDTGAM
jgi:hypothetical protein